MGRWEEPLGRVLDRLRATALEVGDAYPHWADPETGRWVTTADGDWTGGYFAGMCWLAHALTGEEAFRGWAASHTAPLRDRLQGATVFKSFPFTYAALLGWLAGGDEDARRLALDGARSVAAMFDPRLGLVPLGAQAEEGSSVGTAETSIDSLQAAVLLLWAAGEEPDPAVERAGRSHAERVVSLHQREDGSFIQSTSLDPDTGDVLRHYTHKGFSDTSVWGRAQAWGMLFSLAVGAREPAARGADWWLARVPADRVAFWDFDDPAIPETERDTAATAIAASALCRLGGRYAEAGAATAAALVDRHLAASGALRDSCFNKRPDARREDAAAACEFIVGDYYLFETLLRLEGSLPAAVSAVP